MSQYLLPTYFQAVLLTPASEGDSLFFPFTCSLKSEHGANKANLTILFQHCFQLYSNMSAEKITDTVGTVNDPIELYCSDEEVEKCYAHSNDDNNIKSPCSSSSKPPSKKKHKSGNVKPSHIKLLKT